MASEKEISAVRLQKLNLLKEKGVDPYPISTGRNCENLRAIDEFDSLSESGSEFVLAGRIMAIRSQGGLIFFNFFDGTASFQALVKIDDIGEEEFNFFREVVDIGDFVELSGTLFLTKRNEKTLKVSRWKMLSKSLLPLPEKWHGLQDIEERFRKRYLDLLMNEEVRNRFILRSRIIREIRKFYDESGYLEVETPILQVLAGGATAQPFITHHNALGTDFHLTVAQELFLKKLLIGGFNKVYEIGKKFRNEGIDTTHNPEFTMLESNEAYADAKIQREFIEKLFKTIIKNIFGKLSFEYDGKEIGFEKKFEVFTYSDLFEKYAGEKNIGKMSLDEIRDMASKHEVEWDKKEAREKILDGIYRKTIRPNLIQPTFIIDYPVECSPFAKRKESDPALIDRFQLVVGGLEVVNAFSELNNPLDQKERYEEQDRRKKAGEGEISPSDLDYLEAMEYGMPPNGGIGIGIDRLAMLFSDVKNIKEVILFPTLKPIKNHKG